MEDDSNVSLIFRPLDRVAVSESLDLSVCHSFALGMPVTMPIPDTVAAPPEATARRPRAANLLPTEKLLRFPVCSQTLVVVAPHPDDETLAAGGLLFDLARAGWTVSVVVVTDGAASHQDVVGMSGIRAAECRRASQTLGTSLPPTFLGFPDGRADAHVASIALALCDTLRPGDIVVGPRHDDGHSDHRATAEALDRCGAVSQPLRLHYAIWAWEQLSADELNAESAETFRPSPAALIAKEQALGHYESQTTDRYGRVIVGLTQVQRHTSATEIFWW